MSTEVAAVHATLAFKTQGETQAIAAAERLNQSAHRLAEAQKAMGAAAQSSSAQVQAQGLALEAAVQKYNQVAQSVAAANAQLQTQGRTVGQVRTTMTQLSAEVTTTETKLAALRAELQALEASLQQAAASGKRLASTDFRRFYALGPEIQNLEGRLKNLRAELARTQRFEGLVSRRPLVEAEADIERLTAGINRQTGAQTRLQVATRRTANGFRLNQTSLSGFVSALRTGNIGSSVLGQGLAFLSSKIGLLAIGVGAAAIGFVTMAVKMGAIADRLNQINPRFVELAQNLGRVEGIDLTELASQLGLISNRLASFGAAQPEAASAAIATLGQQLAFLKPGAKDADQAILAVQRSIESLSAEPLRDFGAPVDEINAELKRLAEEGFGQSAQRATLFAAAQQHVVANTEQITAAMGRESSSFASLGDEIKRAFEAVATSDQARATIAGLVDSFKDMIQVLTPVLGLVGQLAGLLANALTISMKIVQLAIAGALRAFSFLVRAGAAIPGALGDSFETVADSTLNFAKEIEGAVRNTTEFGRATRLGRDELFQFGRGADEATSKVKEFRDGVAGGFSIVGSIRQIGSAWDEMQEDLSPRTTLDFVESIDRAMGFLAEHGTDSIQTLRDRLQDFFEAGFIDQRQFEAINRGLASIEQVAGPLSDEVKRVEGALGDNTSQAQISANTNNQSLTPSLSGVGSAAATAAGQVGDLTSALSQIPAQVSTTISVNQVGGVSVGPIQQALRGPRDFSAITGGLPAGPGVSTPEQRTSSGLDRSRGREQRFGPGNFGLPRVLPRRTPDFAALAETFRPPKPPDRGGGGGGALATLEEIRELFRQIGSAIKIGINKGVFFSPAGNTIPAGGPNEFLNTQGGTLVQTVNIRGIWDFADPGAKRQIIRELEEALSSLKRET